MGRIFTKVKRSYYYKMLVFYFAFTVLVVALTTSITVKYSDNLLAQEVHQSNIRLLTQVKIFTDRYLIDKINSIIGENFINANLNSTLIDFFSESSKQNDPDTYFKAYQIILNMLVNNEFFDSVALYRKLDDTMVSTREGVNLHASLPDNKLKDIIGQDALKQAMSKEEGVKWVSPAQNSYFPMQNPIISYIQALPLYSDANNKSGVIVFNINQAVLFNNINKVFGQNSGELMVVDSQGNLFAHSNPQKIYEPFGLKEYLENITSGTEGFQVAEIGGANMAITWVRSSLNDWIYISVVPLNIINKQSIVLKQFGILIMLLLIPLSLIGLQLITTRLFKPLKAMTAVATKTLHIEDSGVNEITLIDNLISTLSRKVGEMEDVIDKNHGTIQHKIVLDLLYGNIKSHADFENRINLIGKSFSYPYNFLLVTEVNQRIFSQLPIEQREFITYKITEQIDSHFGSTSLSVNYPSSCIVTIVNTEDTTIGVFECRNLLNIIENDLGVTCNIAVSDTFTGLLDLHNIYPRVNDSMKYSFIYGYSNVFTEKDIQSYESNNENLNTNSFDELKSLLKAGKAEQVKNRIYQVCSEVRKQSYSYASVQNILLQIINAIAITSHEQGVVPEQINKKKIMAEFYSITSLEQSIQWINSLLDLYTKGVIVRNNSIDYEYIEKIAQFVAINIEKQITLNSIADEFSISPSHLSRIFKEALNISFSDYVIGKKLERAAELIVGDSNKDISEIIQKLGYQTPSYFSKIFKERYGFTPMQYRKKYWRSGDYQ